MALKTKLTKDAQTRKDPGCVITAPVVQLSLNDLIALAEFSHCSNERRRYRHLDYKYKKYQLLGLIEYRTLVVTERQKAAYNKQLNKWYASLEIAARKRQDKRIRKLTNYDKPSLDKPESYWTLTAKGEKLLKGNSIRVSVSKPK